MAETFGCRPSDIYYGEARAAVLDRIVVDKAGELIGQAAKMVERDSSGKLTITKATQQVVASYTRQAKREAEARSE